MIFSQASPLRAFEGQGQSLGGDTQPSRLVPSIVHKKTESRVNSQQTVETDLPGKFGYGAEVR